MDDITASRTALATCRMRAIHSRRNPAPVIDDPWGDTLVPSAVLQQMVQSMSAGDDSIDSSDIDAVEQLADDYLSLHPAFANVILRSRYTERALAAVVASGITQYVLIGAGFDSYLLRRPASAAHVTVIEVDHPASQAYKLERLKECGIEIPEGVHFVPADLGRVSLAQVLADSAFDPSRPAFFSWLGVTMYLSRQENMSTLRSVAALGAPGSELVFSYMDQALFDLAPNEQQDDFNNLEESVRAVGEPLVSGFHPAAIAQDMDEAGLVLVEDLDDTELLRQYDPGSATGLVAVEVSHITRAAVR